MKFRVFGVRSALQGATISLALVAPAAAQNMTLGEFEFMNSCAACHGADGKGDGSITGYLNQSVPDLTQLQNDKNVAVVAVVVAVVLDCVVYRKSLSISRSVYIGSYRKECHLYHLS